MDIRETVKKTLNESNLTNPSKLYTPFTLFAVYFAIYFKADTLGRIFLSDDWAVTEKALADLKNPGLIEWFTFAGEVTVYSLLMLFLYGIAQAIAVSIWATSNRIHSSIASKLERGKFVASSLLDNAEHRIESIRSDNRKLYTELASYHQWKPEDIHRLENDIKNQKIDSEKEISKLRSDIRTLKNNEEKFKELIKRHIKNTGSMFVYTRETDLEINSTKIEDTLNLVSLEARKNVAEIFKKMKSDKKKSSTWYFVDENEFLPNALAILKNLQFVKISLHFNSESMIGADVTFKESFWHNIDNVISHLAE